MTQPKQVDIETFWWATEGIRIDRVSVEVHQALQDAGVGHVLLKGPAIAQWIYDRSELRAYGDSDFLVPRRDWERVGEILSSLGFAPKEELAHPGLSSFSSAAWTRGRDNVDLHATLSGLHADFDQVWRLLGTGTTWIPVLNDELPVLDEAARALHLALHAAHHHRFEDRPREDLTRGVQRLPVALWREAAQLAIELDGLPAFAAGLRQVPIGVELAEKLGVADLESIEVRLKETGIPLAASLNALVDTPGVNAKARLVADEFAPSPAFMRWWSPLARRGRRGLIAAYVYRPFWLVRRLPAAARAVVSERRRRDGAGR